MPFSKRRLIQATYLRLFSVLIFLTMSHNQTLMDPPKVSVIMSVYNGSKYLRESVDSILNQTFTDFEFIIFDDCSTDDSWEILNSYAELDSRIVVRRNERNLGLTKTLNQALSLARGDYIARQDDDDISFPNRLLVQTNILERDKHAVFVSSNIEMIDADGCPYGTIDRACSSLLAKWNLLFHNYVAGHSQVVFRKQPALSLGGYNEKYQYAQDYELWCRLSEMGEFHILPEILTQQRFHSNSISSAKKEIQEKLVAERVRVNISKILERQLSIREARALFKFWARASVELPSGHIYSLISEIYASYYKKYGAEEPSIKLEIKQAIAKKFFVAFASTSLREKPVDKLNSLKLAYNWNFGHTLDKCFKYLFGKTAATLKSYKYQKNIDA